MKNDTEAEDVAQEATIKAFPRAGQVPRGGQVQYLAGSIGLNEARGRLRKTGRMVLESLDEASADGDDFTPMLLADWREIPSEALQRKELARHIEQALPLIYREVFMLRDQEQLSIDEIAQALCVSTGLVKVRLHRARIMLQKRLAPILKQAVSPSKSWWHVTRGRQ